MWQHATQPLEKSGLSAGVGVQEPARYQTLAVAKSVYHDVSVHLRNLYFTKAFVYLRPNAEVNNILYDNNHATVID